MLLISKCFHICFCLVVVIISSIVFAQFTVKYSWNGTCSSLISFKCIHVVIRIYTLSFRRPKRFSVSNMFFSYSCINSSFDVFRLSYFVIDTNLSNEAVMKLQLSFTLKLSNSVLINFSEFWAMTSIFSDYSTSQHSVLANVHHNFSLWKMLWFLICLWEKHESQMLRAHPLYVV